MRAPNSNLSELEPTFFASRFEFRFSLRLETHEKEQSLPWVIGVVEATLSYAPAASKPFDPTTDAVQFEAVKANEPVLRVRLYEGLEPGSTGGFIHTVYTCRVPVRESTLCATHTRSPQNPLAVSGAPESSPDTHVKSVRGKGPLYTLHV